MKINIHNNVTSKGTMKMKLPVQRGKGVADSCRWLAQAVDPIYKIIS